MKPRRCPRCRGNPSFYTEVWEGHTIEFEADKEGFPSDTGYLNPGNPYRVTARCSKCGYNWRLRGVGQITDLEQQNDSGEKDE